MSLEVETTNEGPAGPLSWGPLAGYVEKILSARVYDVAIETPLERARGLSTRLGNEIFLKREDRQSVFSFKCRGAHNAIYQRKREGLSTGVVAASAGNHGQGVAMAATQMGLRSVVVMPRTTPSIKVEAVRALGAEVVLHGDGYDDACARAYAIGEEEELEFIHAFDDPHTIAGQGTIAVEICRQHPDPMDAVFVPVGGGGLVAGMAAFFKSVRPDTKVIGVEPEDADAMARSLEAGERVFMERVGLFADGVAVRQVGAETFRICQTAVDEIVRVDVDAICAAIKDVFEETRTLLEPAGALAVAGMKKWVNRESAKGQRLVAVASGANVNFDRLRHVGERAEIGESREALFGIGLEERPGSFLELCESLGRRSVTEFNYRFSDLSRAWSFVGFGLEKGLEERESVAADLRRRGYDVFDLTDDEMSKTHLRHLVGGRAKNAADEKLYRFEFPERPGALADFLEKLSGRWNISLFHYRNHGAAYGRVLVGFQVQERDEFRFAAFLDEVGYPHFRETSNPAYGAFLK